jgi:hypothetical protein
MMAYRADFILSDIVDWLGFYITFPYIYQAKFFTMDEYRPVPTAHQAGLSLLLVDSGCQETLQPPIPNFLPFRVGPIQPKQAQSLGPHQNPKLQMTSKEECRIVIK